ncbi:MAG: alkaline phosphatase D family protein [Pseudomonadota bacterium]|nr:alkaline phosphatase D family protein [Pseudomonadota bacterium]
MHSRRNFIKSGFTAGLAAISTLPLSGYRFFERPKLSFFQHGVASGDPKSNQVILWTRITLPKAILKTLKDQAINVNWQVALDPDFQQIINDGLLNTSKEKDFTVKVDALLPVANQHYYYRFSFAGQQSPTGRTKTLASGPIDQAKIAFTSCSHFMYGYFNVYARIAEQKDLDAVLHLGDYLYEYGNDNSYKNAFLKDRRHQPEHEMITLSDYRQRHAQYKTDTDLQALHQTHPTICIWDDHEFTNDANKLGAENHQPSTEGLWSERAQHAIQAYYEWMPIREPSSDSSREKSYRHFRFGDLVDLSMLDTRFIGRDPQIVEFDGRAELDPSQELLGLEQREWLKANLFQAQQSNVTWKILGQQIQIMQLKIANQYVNKDAWDGYQAERNRLLDFVETQQINNVVVLTGDIHSSWAAEIHKNPYDQHDSNPLAVELVTPSVTSPTIPIPGIQQLVGDIARIIYRANPHIKYVNIKNRGYVVLQLSHQKARAQWFHVPVVSRRNSTQYLAREYWINSGEAKLHHQPLKQLSS